MDKRTPITIGREKECQVTIGGHRCRIVVPLTSSDAVSLASESRTLAGHPVDLVEWRVDRYTAFISASTLNARLLALDEGLSTLRESVSHPVIATIRSASEGGAAQMSEDEYAVCIGHLAQHVDIVDIELGHNRVEELIVRAHDEGAQVIVSHHNFVATPKADVILSIFRSMASVGADIAKVAYASGGPHDLAAVVNALAHAQEEIAIPVVGIAMGEAGLVSRIGGNALGNALTFATVGAQSAPGQMSARDVREILDVVERPSNETGTPE